ncbi:MATE family efflux transporter [Biformimicrobium ophioploci]|uniref:Multidrug export protein MepA n=1 Tax=Biformimicrobium ophioploci TaxID=3036711 RepID=A0ABQ6LYM6_9GAMM|nr:MATE family efflux transporter [Microbulbifer sp. NKW57]GMG87142.1 MATE family efflux transporter [Microbulbifer sp. NKW57]
MSPEQQETAQQPSASDMALRDEPVGRLFWRYALPTVSAMLVTGIYGAIDGIFVGQVIGADGMAGVMLGYAIGGIVYAIGAGIGMGAAALVAIALGRGDVASARRLVGASLTMCILAAVLLIFPGLSLANSLLYWLGASERATQLAADYLLWYFLLGFFPIIAMAFSALMRNDGHPRQVTLYMVIGGLLNILLDYLLIVVVPLELHGASIATMLSQLVTGGLCLLHFFGRNTRLRISWDTLRLRWKDCRDIMRTGLSSFLMYLYLSVVLTMHNKALLWVGQTIHVAAYGILSYIESFFYLVFEGVALAIQPITSFNFGAGKWERVKQARNYAFLAAFVPGVIGLVLLFIWPDIAIRAFIADDPEVIRYTRDATYLYFWVLPAQGLLLVGAIYFQSIKMANEAAMLVGGKLVLVGIALVILAKYFGVDGVWVTLPLVSWCLVVWMWVIMRRADARREGAV